jgi:HEAT repeat protein
VTRTEPPRASPGPQGTPAHADDIDDSVQQLTSSENGKVRVLAALDLAKLGDRRAIRPLANVVVGDGDMKVRGAAAVALGKVVNDRATPDEKEAAVKALTQAKLDPSNS